MLDEERDVSEFPLVSTVTDNAGTYRCQYEAAGSQETSELSDPVELVLTDPPLGAKILHLDPEISIWTPKSSTWTPNPSSGPQKISIRTPRLHLNRKIFHVD
ncbi:UNVERIFIED_CONTAM: hypothetical protein H355_014771 [Colinus virginianus]|nr:hypothetical protein H355_014771 [Colinus virginianus]